MLQASAGVSRITKQCVLAASFFINIWTTASVSSESAAGIYDIAERCAGIHVAMCTASRRASDASLAKTERMQHPTASKPILIPDTNSADNGKTMCRARDRLQDHTIVLPPFQSTYGRPASYLPF
jgi:hypothetical protein